jgi:hypothetical protein
LHATKSCIHFYLARSPFWRVSALLPARCATRERHVVFPLASPLDGIDWIAALAETRFFRPVYAVARDQLGAQRLKGRNGLHAQFSGQAYPRRIWPPYERSFVMSSRYCTLFVAEITRGCRHKRAQRSAFYATLILSAIRSEMSRLASLLPGSRNRNAQYDLPRCCKRLPLLSTLR